jgi:hypothetical protein
MAKNKNKNKKIRKKKKYSGNRDAGPPRRKRDGNAAMKGMVTGGILIVAFIGLLWPFGGTSVLDRISDAIAGDGDKPAVTEKAKPKAVVRPAPKIIKAKSTAAKPVPKPAVSKNAAEAPPLEKISEESKTKLDELIDSKTK